MRRLNYTDEAKESLRDIARFIAEQSGSFASAEAFLDRIGNHCGKLAELPGTLGTSRPELLRDIRSTPFQRYVIFFRYTPGEMEIIDILAGDRDLERHFDS
jgi:toxin ParE1/3/4